ncbi:MAG: hypothetical protein P4L79_03740 [Legionella sp.]|uniref:hypothetical protein n=1 Tax=Legionella sp. TaxID=459 RepID=UPI00283C23A3|nr:hypothetical protein [Legionella sp.]
MRFSIFESDNKLDNLATKENMLIVGGIFAACALAAVSLTAFFVALAATICFFGFQALQENDDSITVSFKL